MNTLRPPTSSSGRDKFGAAVDNVAQLRANALRIALLASMIHSANSPDRASRLTEQFLVTRETWKKTIDLILGDGPSADLSQRELGWMRGTLRGHDNWVTALTKADQLADHIHEEIIGSERPGQNSVGEFFDFYNSEVHEVVTDLIFEIWTDVHHRLFSAQLESRRGQTLFIGALDKISEISQSVRLISLNAAVEAAHAGEAGRGFSVIAQEIKALSEQIQTTTHEVGEEVNALNLN